MLKNPEKKVANFGKSQRLMPQSKPNSMFFEVLSDGETPNRPVNRRKKFKNLEFGLEANRVQWYLKPDFRVPGVQWKNGLQASHFLPTFYHI